MADYITLPAQLRTARRKENQQLRREGITPIVVYGRHVEPVSLQAESKTLTSVLSKAGTSRIIAIDVEGEDAPRLALARDYQRHVTKLWLLHADFLEVAMDEMVRSDVPVRVSGEPAAVRANEGILDVLITAVSVEALPANLPWSLDIDASEMEEFGEVFTVADLATGKDFLVLADGDEVVCRLSQARIIELDEEIEDEEGEELEEGEIAEGEEAEQGDEESTEDYY